MGVLLDIAWTHLRGRTRQTVISIAGVATGVGFFIAMSSLMEGSQRDLVEKIIDTSPHVLVKDEFRSPPRQPVERLHEDAAIALYGLKPKEELRGIRNPRARLAAIREIDGVIAAPILRGQVVMRNVGKDMTSALIGIEPESYRLVSDLEDDMVEGGLADLRTSPNGVILGDGLARRLGISVGDSVSVTSPAGVLLRMTVVGRFHTGVVAADDGEAYCLLKKAQIAQNRPNVINQIRLRVADVNRAGEIARRIERQHGYQAVSWDEANAQILDVFIVRNAIMYTVVSAILIVAGFGIFNIISTVTYEKARDIAILKSLGFEERDIRGIFLAQGLVVGGVGAVVGWVFGYGLCLLLSTIRFEMSWVTDMSRLPLYWGLPPYGIAAVFALVSAGLAAYLPARKAARLNPVDIIRGAA